MTPDQLSKCRWRLMNDNRWFGGIIRRTAVTALAEDGMPEAVEALAEAAARTKFGDVRERAIAALRQVRGAQAIDRLCAVWAETRDDELGRLIQVQGLVARGPADLEVLTALKARKLDALAEDREGMLELLMAACEDADPEIAQAGQMCLIRLSKQTAIDALCATWADTRRASLAAAIVKAGHIAAQPIRNRVLSALKTGKLDIVTTAGAEVVEVLVAACADADAEIAGRAREAAGQLKNADAREALCRFAWHEGNTRAALIAVNAGYAP